MLKYTRDKNGNEKIEEVCEHCEDKVRDVHISDLAVKVDGDGRTVKVKDAANKDVELKERKAKILEVKRAAATKSLIDLEDEAGGDWNSDLKYQLRAEAMCSESIEIDGTTFVTRSYCYKPTEKRVEDKVIGGVTLKAKWAAASEKSGSGAQKGSKRGIDRKGNIIYFKGERERNADTGRWEEVKIEYPWNVKWVRDLKDKDVDKILHYEEDCDEIAGKAGTVGDYEEWQKLLEKVCR
tara:strand:- start:16 stop:729 length:714 start_codon:yes stop_codon:yes gene_type:complete